MRGVLGLIGVLLLSVLIALAAGSHSTSLPQLWAVLIGHGDERLQFILTQVRVPRIALAILTGGALGLAGLMLQALLRNPLASPDVIGVTGGGAVMAVMALTLLNSAWSAYIPLLSMLGAGLTTVLLSLLAGPTQLASGRLVLIGIGLAAAAQAITTLLMVMSSETSSLQAYVWLMGSLYAAEMVDVWGMLPWTVLGLVMAWLMAAHLDVMQLGEMTAQGLGAAVRQCRLGLLLTSAMLAGSAVAYAGGLSFVGLIAPHIARRCVRAGFAWQATATVLIGAEMVLLADTIGRVMFLPQDLPAGIFVAAVGAPCFVYLLYRQRRTG
ncbi:hypothetical protein BFW38_13745 [Terasakiispira papahanaumokuakeensis]|uniref:Iron ABC transporter permease n=1 Tax=Terasakiispira papahanaumokuakeensis TaxID=197479 RepID=A0A1E2VC87_9GAMM|nr:iron ABC transporter permease [Terasakiispira papahanaumokuakeensis]ODC04436.1 hypothetical protein BFW38_13745 [Terasakiispira papahanaumokuakeensis]